MLPKADVQAAPVFGRVPRTRAIGRVAEVPVAAWLAGLVAVSAALRYALASWMPVPWIFADELKYSELARSFAATGHFAIRDVPGSGLGPLYPILIAPAYAVFESVPHAYIVVKAINAVVMSLAAVPTYLLARRLLTRSWSLVAAAFAVFVPSMVYTGTIMTENVFYPLFLTAALGTLRALERPTVRRQLGALGLIALTFLARAQAVALLPALVTAIVATSAVDASSAGFRLRGFVRHLARYLPTWIGLLAVPVALGAWESLRGRSPLAVLGDGQNVFKQHHSVLDVARWFAYHVAELDLYVGVLPFAALLILAMYAGSRRDRELRIFAVTAVSFGFWLLLAVAVFASGLTRYDPHAVSHVEDRYTFYVAPLLLIAFFAWVSQRIPGSARAAAVAALVSGVLVLTLPFDDLIRNNAVADTLALLPWSVNLSNGAIVAKPHVLASVGLVILSLAGLFYLLRPPRLPQIAPLLVFVYFVAVSATAERMYHSVSSGSAIALQPERDWIDRAIGPNSDAVVIWSGRADPHVVWENEFFNRSVGPVYYLRVPSWAGLPEEKLSVSRRTGALVDASGVPLHARYVLADPWVVLRGRIVARDRTSGMRLYRLDGPNVRISAL